MEHDEFDYNLYTSACFAALCSIVVLCWCVCVWCVVLCLCCVVFVLCCVCVVIVLCCVCIVLVWCAVMLCCGVLWCVPASHSDNTTGFFLIHIQQDTKL